MHHLPSLCWYFNFLLVFVTLLTCLQLPITNDDHDLDDNNENDNEKDDNEKDDNEVKAVVES